MSDETKSRFQVRTEAVVKDDGERALEVSVDQTGAYLRTSEHGVCMPVAVLRDALERAGVLDARAAPVATLLERDRDSWKANAERLGHERDAARAAEQDLRRDLAEARAEVERERGERDAARAPSTAWAAALPLEAVLQCIGGVLNDMTRGGELKKADADEFHHTARARLRSLAGSPEGKARGRLLTRQEEATLFVALSSAPSYSAWLRWLEREGYLSVRLPPEG